MRRLAKSLGIEKIVLKNQQMILHLLTNKESPYYQSSEFEKLITYAMNNTRSCKLREVGNKRSLVIKNVTTVENAVAILEDIKEK